MGDRCVAYFRASTAKQGRSGLGLDAQREAVRAFASGARGATVLAEYTDVESGKSDARPQLRRAVEHCRISGARLLIAKLDRLSRDPDFIGHLLKSEVRFTAVDMPDANELTVRIMAAVAEAERRAISERTKRALAAAKARGTKLGTPGNLRNQLVGSRKGNATRSAQATEFARRLSGWIADGRAQGASSLRELAVYLNQQHVRTARGHEWTATQVARVLSRSE